MKLSEISQESSPTTDQPKKLKLSDISPQKETEQPSFLSRALKPVRDIPEEVSKEFSGGTGLMESARQDEQKALKSGGIPNPLMALKYLGGLAQSAMSPATGAANALVRKPAQENIPQDTMAGRFAANTLGDAAQMFSPGAGAKVLGTAGKIIPSITPEAKALLASGVRLTPGQMFGGMAKRTEEAAKSVPVLGHFIRGAEKRAVEDFNAKVINEALDPIGEALPKDVKSGHEAIQLGHDALNSAYDKVLSKTKFQIDPGFVKDVTNLKSMAAEMPPAQAEQFNTILKNRVADRLSPGGKMDGRTMKQVESELRNYAATYKTSSDAAQRQLGNALDEVRSSLRSALIRQNPEAAERLGDIDRSYALFARVEGASARRAGSGMDGTFSANDLLQTSKQMDRSVRKNSTARGQGLLQRTGEQGQKTLGNTFPDSGTAERLMYNLGGGALAERLDPRILMALLGASAPYTRPGSAVVRKVLTQSPEAIQAVLNATGQVSPYAVAGQLVMQQNNGQGK